MFVALMAIFAFVVAALALVAVSLTMSYATKHIAGLDSRLLTLSARVDKSSQTALKAEVDDLRGALDVVRASNRREFGSIWGRLGGKPRSDVESILMPTPTRPANDDSFEAMLALQSTPSPQPK